MKPNLLKLACIVAILVPTSGCPSTSAGIALGIWFFDLNSSGIMTAAELQSNGAVAVFPPNNLPEGADETFLGTLYWGRSGSSFLMAQDFGPEFVIYTGTIASRTSIVNGTYIRSDGASGTFTAMR